MRLLRGSGLVLPVVLLAGFLAPAPVSAAAADVADVSASTIAPGLVLERRTADDGSREALLRLSAGSSTRPVLLQQDLSSPRTPADLATAAGAVAAVNGDFFDIDRTGTPDGPVASDGQALKADATPQWAVGIDGASGSWTGRVGQVLLQGSATVGERTFPLAALGTRTVPADALALFSPAWGDGDRSLTATGGVELEVRGGRVSAVRSPGATPVPADGFVLVGTGTVASALAGTPVGASARTDVRVRDDALVPGSTGFALGARLELVRDGELAPIDASDPTWAALRARTAIGWTRGGDLLLLTVEGGTSRSPGVTAVQTAQRMLEAGADGAVMLDGGGSAQMVARTPGDAGVSEVVVPSDGAARPVANAIGLVPAAVGPDVASVVLRPELGRAAVFPGLGQLVRAVPVDASGAPTAGSAVLTSTDPAVVAVEGSRLRGLTPGRAAVTAAAGAGSGRLEVEVLDRLDRLGVGAPLALPTAGSTTDVTITGRDAQGRTAPVDVSDLTVAVDPAVLRAEPLPDGRLRLTSLVDGPISTPLQLTALTSTGVVPAAVPVAVGTRPVLLDPLDDPAAWTVATTRATASAVRVPVGDLPGTTSALRLTYDFTGQPAGTTTAAVVARTPVPLPAGSTGVALQVRGDGAGGWLRGVLRVDGAARPVTFAARVDFTGWRRLEVPVPAGATAVAVERVYLAQTSVAARRAGAVDLARLEAAVPPLEPPAPVVERGRRRVR
ncbi:phosphodiester glycosidase family protein [Kineococcus sp. SYSU DK003]|uniref:phosphodiester glycosidase family protein n=1 Tax=Kineococcus sp. SYSU DK003 TaxID=3383124 RepID=UPI003D7EC7F9